jgi:AbiV family abortive infection protein
MRNFDSLFDDLKTQGKSLDRRQIAAGLHLCFVNAAQLASEAKLLRENGHLARALSLAILGLEELGKIPLICGAILYDPGDVETWRRFWRGLRSHRTKVRVWSVYGRTILKALSKGYEIEMPSGTDSLTDVLKQLGFYVTYVRDQFVSPEEFGADARERIDYYTALLDERIASFEPLHGSLQGSERFVDNSISLIGAVRGAKTETELQRAIVEVLKAWKGLSSPDC